MFHISRILGNLYFVYENKNNIQKWLKLHLIFRSYPQVALRELGICHLKPSLKDFEIASPVNYKIMIK